jgi:hypothetical protein
MQLLAGQFDDLFQCLFEIHGSPRAVVGGPRARSADACSLVREHRAPEGERLCTRALHPWVEGAAIST